MTNNINGIFSGLDISSMIQALTISKKTDIENAQKNIETIKNLQTQLNQINSFFSSFRDTIQSLTRTGFNSFSKEDLFAKKIATSSDVSKVLATVTSSAEKGSYRVRVDKLATETQAKSGITQLTTAVVTETADFSTKLIDLGVREGNINITKNGVVETIGLTNTDTIQTFIDKLHSKNINASYNANSGIFSLGVDSSMINDIGNTGIVDALNLQDSLREGYITNTLVIDNTTTISSIATTDTLLSDLGVENGIVIVGKGYGNLGAHTTITIDSTTTLGNLITNLNNFGLTAELNSQGDFVISGGYIDDRNKNSSYSNLIDALNLTMTDSQITQTSQQLTYTYEVTNTNVLATNSTKLTDINNVDDNIDGKTIIVKSKMNAGTPTTIALNNETTIDDLVNSLNNAGLVAEFTDGRLSLNNGTIVGGDFDLLSVFNLPDNSSSITSAAIDINTKLGDVTNARALMIKDGSYTICSTTFGSEATFGDVINYIHSKIDMGATYIQDGRFIMKGYTSSLWLDGNLGEFLSLSDAPKTLGASSTEAIVLTSSIPTSSTNMLTSDSSVNINVSNNNFKQSINRIDTSSQVNGSLVVDGTTWTVVGTKDELISALNKTSDVNILLSNDIDMSGLANTISRSSANTVKINGNGFELQNLNKTLFDNYYADIVLENIGFSNVNIPSNSTQREWGSIINRISSVKANNCYVRDSNVAKSAFVQSVHGQNENDVVEINNCYVNNSNITSLTNSGGFIGGVVNIENISISNSEVYNSSILSTYSSGGLIGYISSTNKDVSMQISNVRVMGSNIKRNDDTTSSSDSSIIGGLIGGVHLNGSVYDINISGAVVDAIEMETYSSFTNIMNGGLIGEIASYNLTGNVTGSLVIQDSSVNVDRIYDLVNNQNLDLTNAAVATGTFVGHVRNGTIQIVNSVRSGCFNDLSTSSIGSLTDSNISVEHVIDLVSTGISQGIITTPNSATLNISKHTKLVDMGYTTEPITLSLYNADGSIDTSNTFNVTATSTVNDFMNWLESCGFDNVEIQNGKLSLNSSSSFIYSIDKMDNFGFMSDVATNCTYQTLSNPITINTQLGELGLDGIVLHVNNANGKRSDNISNYNAASISTTASMTLSELNTALSAYDINLSVAADGQVNINYLGEYGIQENLSFETALKLNYQKENSVSSLTIEIPVFSPMNSMNVVNTTSIETYTEVANDATLLSQLREDGNLSSQSMNLVKRLPDSINEYTILGLNTKTIGELRTLLANDYGIETNLLNGVLTLTNNNGYFVDPSYMSGSLFNSAEVNEVYSTSLNNTTINNSTITVNETTLINDIEQFYNETLTGKLSFTINNNEEAIFINPNDSIGDVLTRFEDFGLEATIVDGVISIKSNNNNFQINAANSTSNFANAYATTGLIYKNNFGDYVSSSNKVELDKQVVKNVERSVSNWVDLNTTLSSMNISAGSFSLFNNDVKGVINIDEHDTFGTLAQKVKNVFSNVDLVIEEGYLKISSQNPDDILAIGTSTDNSNFATIIGAITTNGSITSNNELFKAKSDSLLTQEGLYRAGNVTAGTFVIGDAEFIIDNNTTLSDIIERINHTEEANATAYWDSVKGELIIKANNAGTQAINIEKGTSNFTEIFGFTSSSGNLNLSNQTFGTNAEFYINDKKYVSSSNIVGSDITRIQGLTLDLKNVTGDDVIITIGNDDKSLSSVMANFVDNYNKLIEKVDDEIAITGNFNKKTELKAIRNNLVRLVRSSINDNPSFKNLNAIGIKLKEASSGNVSISDIQYLEYDEDKFMECYAKDQDALKDLLIGNGTKEGLLTKIEKELNNALESSGFFAVEKNTNDKKINKLQNNIKKTELRLVKETSMLQSKFKAMEMLIGKMQQAYSSFLV